MGDALQSLEAALNRVAEITSSMDSLLARLVEALPKSEVGGAPDAPVSSPSNEDASDAGQGGNAKITASIESPGEPGMQLEKRLEEAERALASLEAAAASKVHPGSTRKTLPAATVQLLAKQGIDTADAVDVESLDAALAGMSVEQRIAVKSQMLRAGSLTL